MHPKGAKFKTEDKRLAQNERVLPTRSPQMIQNEAKDGTDIACTL
jgi:hypothetical protein